MAAGGCRQGVRPAVRRSPGELGRRTAGHLRLLEKLRPRRRGRAQRGRVQLRPLRLSRVQAGQPAQRVVRLDGRFTGPESVRGGEIRDPSALLPGVPRRICVPRRVPEAPVSADAGRRTRPELPLRRLPPFLPAYRFAHADHVRAFAGRPAPRCDHADPAQGMDPRRVR